MLFCQFTICARTEQGLTPPLPFTAHVAVLRLCLKCPMPIDKGHAVAVFGVHVSLHLKNKARHFGFFWGDLTGFGGLDLRLWSEFPMPSINSLTPKELIVDPNQMGVMCPSSTAWGLGLAQFARHSTFRNFSKRCSGTCFSVWGRPIR